MKRGGGCRTSVVRILSVAVLVAPGAGALGLTDEERQVGFVPLCNGKDLAGWELAGGTRNSFSIRDGALYCNGSANYPTWLRTDREYENFVLRFAFKMPYYTESGLYLHAPLHGEPNRVGIEAELCDDEAKGSKTCPCGSIVGVGDGVMRPKLRATNKSDQWNSVEVLLDWPTLRITINGKVVQDVDMAEHPELRYRLRKGYLGIQDTDGQIAVRDMRIRELPAKDKWTPLFNGRDLTGWHVVGEAGWEVADGVLKASNGNGYVISDGQFEDFELFTYVRTSPYANGGIFFRWLTQSDRGYEIQIYNMPIGHNPTGSIYQYHRARRLEARNNEWFPMHILVRGKSCLVRVNGRNVAEADDLVRVRAGHVALQMHRRDAWIEFKDIRIKRFK